ncbi:unnamed protein product [Menidia menidia]|uniref:(Atlantic silverside) hypothetical protein n=1 Tax=Menidia menidia TaxID=238744 RepID=A0A8S4BZL2_9TELE|nr:unnamed protein product [Menidia menidia]
MVPSQLRGDHVCHFVWTRPDRSLGGVSLTFKRPRTLTGKHSNTSGFGLTEPHAANIDEVETEVVEIEAKLDKAYKFQETAKYARH